MNSNANRSAEKKRKTMSVPAQIAIMTIVAVIGAAAVIAVLAILFNSDPWYVMREPYSVNAGIDGSGDLVYLMTLRRGYDAADVRNGTVIYTDGKRWGAADMYDKQRISFGDKILTFDTDGEVIVTEASYTQADRRGKDYMLWRQDNLLGVKSTNSYLDAYEVGDAVIVVVNGEQNVYVKCR